MKTPSLFFSLALASQSLAGDPAVIVHECDTDSPVSVFDQAIRPITSPTIFDLAVPRTQVHAIFMHQNLPDSVSSVGGGQIPLGGDYNVYALQFEYALDQRTSIVAAKDGYIDFNPDNTLSSEEGLANLAIGIKRALIYKPENQYILSGIATVEIPTGDSEVWQGEGDGALNLQLAELKLYNDWQFASSLSAHLPFNSNESTTGSAHAHASYQLCDWFMPLVEVSWFHTFDSGSGSFNFSKQGGTLLPSVAAFEGGDLINLGSAHAGENRDAVNLAIGFHSKINESTTLGCAYEFPLTDENDGLMDDRITIDLNWTF